MWRHFLNEQTIYFIILNSLSQFVICQLKRIEYFLKKKIKVNLTIIIGSKDSFFATYCGNFWNFATYCAKFQKIFQNFFCDILCWILRHIVAFATYCGDFATYCGVCDILCHNNLNMAAFVLLLLYLSICWSLSKFNT